MADVRHFDPLSYENLGASIVRAMEEQPVCPLPELRKFNGAGIYSLYYSGDFGLYARISEANRREPGSFPIYIGKAEAENARKGDPALTPDRVGPKLFNRVMNHKRSIEAASNLAVEDFHVRVLTVEPTWVALAEIISLRRHRPLWNVKVDGLGNHDPGAGRRNGARPRWDTLHPGRAWAELLAAHPDAGESLAETVLKYLEDGE